MSKGGSDGYDAAYNARLAAIQEQYAGMAQTAFDSWQNGGAKALEEATAQAGLSVLPAQTGLAKAQIGLANAQIDSAMTLLPGQTALSSAQTNLGIQKTANQSSIMDKFYSQLGKNDESMAMNTAGGLVADAFTNQNKALETDAQRRGVGWKANTGLTAEKAKAIGGAQYQALSDTRTKNLNELSMGLA